MKQKLSRKSGFSFECAACGLCCHGKKIQLNPYEILVMADYLSVSSREFMKKYVREDEPFLLFREDSGCVFLDESRCSVHPVRPLACRLYPLGQHLTGEGVEHFWCAELHPRCSGVPGTDGTVAGFLESQQSGPYMEASNRYLELFYRFYRKMYRQLDENDSPGSTRQPSMKSGLLREWFDTGGLVIRYCEERGKAVPADPVARMNIHIKALEEKCGFQQEVVS